MMMMITINIKCAELSYLLNWINQEYIEYQITIVALSVLVRC